MNTLPTFSFSFYRGNALATCLPEKQNSHAPSDYLDENMKLVLSFNVQIKLPIWHTFSVFAHAIKSVPLEYAHVQEEDSSGFSCIYRHYDFISIGISNHKTHEK
jgi:hypothetical protein